jgi:putative intracellular protease/amidase
VKRVLVVCAQRYNGHELWVALGTIKEAKIKFDLVSTDYVIRDEITLQPNRIKKVIDEVTPNVDVPEYDGLMFVSGNMKDTEAYWHNPRTLGFVAAAQSKGMPIAAICCSVPTIRYAAEGRNVSAFPLVRSLALLREAGAIHQNVAVTVDGNLATAEHQMASQVWAESFTELVYGRSVELNLVDPGWRPRGRERKPIPELEALKQKLRRPE